MLKKPYDLCLKLIPTSSLCTVHHHMKESIPTSSYLRIPSSSIEIKRYCAFGGAFSTSAPMKRTENRALWSSASRSFGDWKVFGKFKRNTTYSKLWLGSEILTLFGAPGGLSTRLGRPSKVSYSIHLDRAPPKICCFSMLFLVWMMLNPHWNTSAGKVVSGQPTTSFVQKGHGLQERPVTIICRNSRHAKQMS